MEFSSNCLLVAAACYNHDVSNEHPLSSSYTYSDGIVPQSTSSYTYSDGIVPLLDFVESCSNVHHDCSSMSNLTRCDMNNDSRLVEFDSFACDSDLSLFTCNSVVPSAIDYHYSNNVVDYCVVSTSTSTNISCIVERDVSEVLLSPLVLEEPAIAKMCRSLLNEGGVKNHIISRFNEKLVEAVDKIITEFETDGSVAEEMSTLRNQLLNTHERIDKCSTEDKNGRSQFTKKDDKAMVDHTYMIRSPSIIKRNLKSALDVLHCTKKKLKVHQQKSRRLKEKMKSFEKVMSTLKEKELLSETACSNLKSSFSSSALSAIMTRLRCKEGKLTRTYSPELRSFALESAVLF